MLQLSTESQINYMEMTMDATDSARLGLNLNLSVQPQSYHWIRSPKGTDDEDEDDRRRVDDDGSPEEEPDILEMQVKFFIYCLQKVLNANKALSV